MGRNDCGRFSAAASPLPAVKTVNPSALSSTSEIRVRAQENVGEASDPN
jgi:hypothetical protein